MQATHTASQAHLRTNAVCALVLAALAVSAAWPAQAKITQLILKTTASPALGGASFDQVGQYEQLDGTAYGEVDPNDPANAVIQDIAPCPSQCARHGVLFNGRLDPQTDQRSKR